MKYMKYILFLFLLCITIDSHCQFTNEFNIGEYVEVFNNDSIKINFNCTGTVVDRRCAEFVRIGKIDKKVINVSGPFKDYYIEGGLAFEAVIDTGYLNGKATYYYKNGNIKATGNYKSEIRNGIWKYFYPNGQLKKVLNFINGNPLIASYYTKSGKAKVINGEGKYKGEFYNYKQCLPITIWGKVIDGKMNGMWTLYNSYYKKKIGKELFKNGIFIKGSSGNYEYTDASKIFIKGFCVNENLLLDENSFGCPGYNKGLLSLRYKKANYTKFYRDLLDSLKSVVNYNVGDQWLIIGLTIDHRSKLVELNVFSSINDYRLEKDLFNLIISMKNWEAARFYNQYVLSHLFFTVLVTNNNFIIPAEFLKRHGVY
ncbi:MAG: hypothetical protein K8S16_01210 [Bacteroidales bacterium]|nr:hypothetical protein [Bacteroidales bacterium]